MKAIPSSISGNLALAGVFACASNLAIYAEDRMLAMGIGRTESWLEQAASWLSIALQPWIIVVFWMFELLHIHSLMAVTATAALLTCGVIFLILRRISARWPTVYIVIVALLVLATVGTGYSAFAGFRSIHRYESIRHKLP